MTLFPNQYDAFITEKFNEFIGFSFQDISYKLGMNPDLFSRKVSIVTLVNRMIDYTGLNKYQLTQEVLPDQLSIKTIRLQPNGKPKESMSFEQVNFVEIVNENWHDSKLRKKFSETIFLFFVFQYKEINDGRVLLFKGVKLWKMPMKLLDNDLKTFWEKTKDIVMQGVILKNKVVGNKIYVENNLPGMNDNNVAHIRPKAKDSNDKVELPDSQMITKQAYWLNSRYIEFILEDMPEVSWIKTNYLLDKTNFFIKDVKSLTNKLCDQVYPVEEFIFKVKQVIPGFTEMDVNHELLSEIGFKLENRFILKEEVESIDQYLFNTVFSSPYFQVPEKPLFNTQYVKRKIDNLENDYKLLKIDNNLYITNNSLLSGGVTKEDLIRYKEEVEKFVEYGEFFTIRSLERKHFSHGLEEYGFEEEFFESILMRPGRLKYLKVADQILFVKSRKKVTLNDFIAYLLMLRESISVDKLIDRARSLCSLYLEYDYAIKLMKSTAYYYSAELLKLYVNKECYYREIYK